MMGWTLGGNWETEVIRARIVAKLGTERAAKLEAGYDPNHPLIIPPGVEYQGINLGMLEQYEQLKQLSGFGMLGASNNWVVDGTMSTTGMPILCNDPHLGQAVPSIWYECHLVAGDIDVIGVSFPGVPGIVIGHNQYIAWGFTNAISDVEDLYIEKFNPNNPYQYEYMGKWEDAQVVREEIKVKGSRSPVNEEVRITRHGPILTSMPHPLQNDKFDSNGNTASEFVELPLALRWTGLEKHVYYIRRTEIKSCHKLGRVPRVLCVIGTNHHRMWSMQIFRVISAMLWLELFLYVPKARRYSHLQVGPVNMNGQASFHSTNCHKRSIPNNTLSSQRTIE